MKFIPPLAPALTPAFALAGVADSSASGFTIKLSVPIHASPEEVYRQLIKVAAGEAHGMLLREAVQRRRSPAPRGGVRGAGPAAIAGRCQGDDDSIPAAGEGSKLDLTCAVSGCLAAGMNTGAAPVDGVLKEQVTRLRAGSRPGR